VEFTKGCKQEPNAKPGTAANLTSPRQVSQLLSRYGLSAKKSLGQNFLVDGNILRKIITAAQVGTDDLVLEVGTGIGALTKALAKKAGRVISVETDRTLEPVLQEVLGGEDNVSIFFADILKVKVEEVFVPSNLTPKVVANLPYYITTPVLFHLLEAKVDWDSLVFLIQKEVAERVVASAGSKTYGALSVMVQHKAQAELVGVVPPTVFLPRPKVYSAILRLKPKKRTYPEETEKIFKILVKAAFNYRRKRLFNSLRGVFPKLGGEAQVKKAFQLFKISDNNRGEDLSPEEFLAMAAFFAKKEKIEN